MGIRLERIVGTLLRLTRGKLTIKGNSPGKSVVMTGEGVEGQTMTAEVYQAPGVLAIPGDGSRGVWLPVGGSSRYGVVVAMQNYALTIQVEAGETAIYSTDAAGGTVKALVKLRTDGTIEINGDTKRLVTWQELQTALSTLATTIGAHVHASNGTPSPTLAGLSCDIAAAKTTTVKTGG
jgi:phage gp45-like